MFNKVTFYDCNETPFTYGATVMYKRDAWEVESNTSCRLKLRNGNQTVRVNPESVEVIPE